MANNYFKIFDENLKNILDNSSYSVDSERTNGFEANTPIHSQMMNTVLRQCSLITTAIVDKMNDEGYISNDVGPNVTYSTFKTYYSNFMNSYFKSKLGLSGLSSKEYITIWNGSTNQFKTLSPSSTYYDYVLGIKANSSSFSLIKSDDVSFGSADSATKVTTYIANQLITDVFESNSAKVKNATNSEYADELVNFTNESEGTTVKFTFGPTGNKTTFEHQINVEVPGSVESATNVTAKINGKYINTIFEDDGITVKDSTDAENVTTKINSKLISDIFEDDGITAKNATDSKNSTNAIKVTTYIADQLLTAIFESDGVTVKKATYATSCDTATYATNSTNSTNATKANSINGGTSGSIPYQSGVGITTFLGKPSENENHCLYHSSSNTKPEWVLFSEMEVGSAKLAEKADSADVAFELDVSDSSINKGSIPYKDESGVYNYITPPTSANEPYMMIAKKNSNDDMIPTWTKQQVITVVENSDGTVDVTITNV